MSSENRINEMYYGTFGSRDSHLHERERVHWVCSQATGNRVLEVGCSQGIVSILLAREGFDVVATEVETDLFEYALAERNDPGEKTNSNTHAERSSSREESLTP